MAKKWIDVFLWEQGFYPFSLKYDMVKALESNEAQLEDLELDPTAQSILDHSPYFNEYFQSICAELASALKGSNLGRELFIELLIAALNRIEVVVSGDTKRVRMENSSFDANALSNLYITKSEFQNGSEQSWGLIDSAIDTTILNLEYLNHIKFPELTHINDEEVEGELKIIQLLKNITIIGSAFNLIKQAYDRSIWRGYTIEKSSTGLKLHVDVNHLMLDNAALTRLTRNTIATYEALRDSRRYYQDIIAPYHKNRKHKMLRDVVFSKGGLRINYKAKERTPTHSYLSFSASLLTYYPFFHSVEISNFHDLTVLDLVGLFSNLHDLISSFPLPNYDDTEVKALAKLQEFNPKVRKSDLLHYFIVTTKYSVKQISIFIELLIQKGNNHNLYRHSIYQDGEFLFFSHSTIQRCNMLYLVDRWLDDGGVDLSVRGYQFEKYIRNFLKTQELNKHAQFQVSEQSMFSVKNDENSLKDEEIDLVLVTDSSIILAEVKCIKYPLESSDFYSSWQIIKKAKEQVSRKAEFLENNWPEFSDILGENSKKTINKIIIVNLPHFAGRNIEGVPVADFYLFLSYFQAGELSLLKREKGKAATLKSILYYNSKKEFENNFSSFFSRPIPIYDLVSRQEIEEFEVTLNGTEPKTVAERVIYRSL